MSVKSQIDRPAGIDKFISDTYVLCNQKESSWVKEGTGEGTGIPAQKMHTSNLYMLEITSRLYRGKDNGYMPTQYVVGASTHYVEDYYEDKDGNFVMELVTKAEADTAGYQFRPGLRSIYGEDKLRKEEANTKRLAICFEKGRLNLSKYGDNPVFRRFIAEHEQNKKAPNAEINRDPQRMRLFMFEPLIQENKAAKRPIVEQFDDNLEGLNFVAKLRTKTDKGYSYNEKALDAIMNIIQEGQTLQPGEVVQKFEIAAKAAKVDGGSLMKLINKYFDQYRLEIGKAAELNVIEFTAKDVSLMADGKRSSIYTFKKEATKDEIINDLILYFIGEVKGKADFNEMKRQSEIAKIKLLAK